MAKVSTLALDIQKEISILRKQDNGQWLHSALQRIEDAVNALAKNGALAAKGILPAPPPINELAVKTNGTGLVHAVITDNSAIQKGIHYFVEYDTDPNFTRPHVAHLGASRTMNPIMLPAMDDDGNPQSFHFRAYSQYPGGSPGHKIHAGGAVDPGGTQALTLLPSTGSGTAQASGEQGGSGFGKVLSRPANGPKRNSK